MKIQTTLALLTVALASATAAQAADYPAKPIRMLVGFAPGGGTDTTARPIAAKLGDVLGQQVIVDNRPGAAGTFEAGIYPRSLT